MVRVLQCAAPRGTLPNVLAITASTRAWSMVDGSWRARARRVQQAIEPVLDEPCSPLARHLRCNALARRNHLATSSINHSRPTHDLLCRSLGDGRGQRPVARTPGTARMARAQEHIRHLAGTVT